MRNTRALLLAAGLGTRLHPFTEHCPKCLIPIAGRPLLEYWLCTLNRCNVNKVYINIHHHKELVESFLARSQFSGWVEGVLEEHLLGTAGSLRQILRGLPLCTTILIHADNWCHCNFQEFVDYHYEHRPNDTSITMMTFRTSTPGTCGIVEVDKKGVVHQLYEKVKEPPGNLANGAVYIIEPEVLYWVINNPGVRDFSNEVLPQFLGNIATWENKEIHRDIGVLQSLIDAQYDPQPNLCWLHTDEWLLNYRKNIVHKQLAVAMERT